ncbi:hypothetical protein AKJ16_DCAP08340 [Drosera capensis]
MNEQINCFPRNSSSITTSNLRVSRISASIGMNLRLRVCVGNNSYRQDSVRNCGLRRGDKGLDCGGGFGKMKAIRMNGMPVYEVGLHQENKSGSSLLFPNGHSLQEKLVVAVDVDEADIRVHEFFKTSYFRNAIHPIPGAHKALHKLSNFCRLSVVTSRQNAIKDQTIKWIEMHYPGLFREIHFGNHFALDGTSRPKSDICRSMEAKVLIDDNPEYAIDCAEAGIKVLLFDYENSYPWSKDVSVDQHPLAMRVHNWEQVEQQLISWISS